MKIEGSIIRTKHNNTDYFYRPSTNSWVKDVKQISIGDIFFQGIAVKLYLGGNPTKPKPEDFPGLPHDNWEHVDFSIITNII